MNKGEGEGGAAGRDEDATGGRCSGEGESCDRFGGGADAVFLLLFSVPCGLGRAPEEVAEEMGYLIRTIRRPGVSNEGRSFTKCSAPRIEMNECDIRGVIPAEVLSVCTAANIIARKETYRMQTEHA